jgi:hypothetical protein
MTCNSFGVEVPGGSPGVGQRDDGPAVVAAVDSLTGTPVGFEALAGQPDTAVVLAADLRGRQGALTPRLPAQPRIRA